MSLSKEEILLTYWDLSTITTPRPLSGFDTTILSLLSIENFFNNEMFSRLKIALKILKDLKLWKYRWARERNSDEKSAKLLSLKD